MTSRLRLEYGLGDSRHQDNVAGSAGVALKSVTV